VSASVGKSRDSVETHRVSSDGVTMIITIGNCDQPNVNHSLRFVDGF